MSFSFVFPLHDTTPPCRRTLLPCSPQIVTFKFESCLWTPNAAEQVGITRTRISRPSSIAFVRERARASVAHSALTHIQASTFHLTPESPRDSVKTLKELLTFLDDPERLDLCGLAVNDELIGFVGHPLRGDAQPGRERRYAMPFALRKSLPDDFGLQRESLEDMVISRWRPRRSTSHDWTILTEARG